MTMAYQRLAYYYDLLMQDAPYEEWTLFTEQMIRQSGKTVASIIDLGCGTGQVTLRLAEAGYRMTGVDHASSMLSLAEQRASAEDMSIQWMRQDLRTLTGIEGYDMAISYCDVLNYITEPDELQKVFNNIAGILKPGGLFSFDVHSLFHVNHHLVNQTFAEVSDAVTCIWFCLPGQEEGEMHHDLTFFAENDNDQYDRFDEWHHQRTFPVDVYERLLNKAGLDVIHLSGDFSRKDALDEWAERVFITAVKRSE